MNALPIAVLALALLALPEDLDPPPRLVLVTCLGVEGIQGLVCTETPWPKPKREAITPHPLLSG